ncbi:MAG: RING finger protein, partial [Oscillospiraceae bacterium]
MTRYEGLPCSICGEKFGKDSDVVVCPKCGAPYHRDCYKKKGECLYSDKHGSDFVWELPLDQLPPERITVCLKCKTPNAKENLFCKNCGNKLDDNVKVVSITKVDEEGAPPFGSSSAEESFAGISAKEISAYVGNNSF